jgi:hypothetical protein
MFYKFNPSGIIDPEIRLELQGTKNFCHLMRGTAIEVNVSHLSLVTAGSKVI